MQWETRLKADKCAKSKSCVINNHHGNLVTILHWLLAVSRGNMSGLCRGLLQGDRRPTRVQAPKNALSVLERLAVLAVAQSDEFGHMCPSQIVLRLADQGRCVASESTFYRVPRAANQLQHRGAERPRTQRSKKPRALLATAPKQLFSWDITYLPTLRMGSFFYL